MSESRVFGPPADAIHTDDERPSSTHYALVRIIHHTAGIPAGRDELYDILHEHVHVDVEQLTVDFMLVVSDDDEDAGSRLASKLHQLGTDAERGA